jgi:hypothetical protein
LQIYNLRGQIGLFELEAAKVGVVAKFSLFSHSRRKALADKPEDLYGKFLPSLEFDNFCRFLFDRIHPDFLLWIFFFEDGLFQSAGQG